MGLSLDKLSLLHIVHRYTGNCHALSNRKTRFLKELHLSVLVYRAIESGIFRDYDWARPLRSATSASVDCWATKTDGT